MLEAPAAAGFGLVVARTERADVVRVRAGVVCGTAAVTDVEGAGAEVAVVDGAGAVTDVDGAVVDAVVPVTAAGVAVGASVPAASTWSITAAPAAKVVRQTVSVRSRLPRWRRACLAVPLAGLQRRGPRRRAC